jgi:hypothetical protein
MSSKEAVRHLPGEIPEAHREIFDAIDHEITWLHLVWKMYRQLFGRDKETVDLLNSAIPAFARVIQDSLLDDVLLSVSRLSDPVDSGKGRDNLVLERLRPLVASAEDERLMAKFDGALSSLNSTCANLKPHRDKRIAHLDLGVALKSVILAGYSRQMIEDALLALRNAMNAIHLHFRGAQTMYEATSASGEADLLLGCLRDAKRFRALRRNHHKLDESQLRKQLLSREKLDLDGETI